MRVIAGTHRHRKLVGPPDAETTRPITDRVKQALFDRLTARGMLGERMEDPFGPTLDLFAGTGGLGIEALSRGSRFCTFVESDRTIQRVLRTNLESLGLMDRSRIVSGSALLPMWLDQLESEPLALVFMDPPYKLMGDGGAVERMMGVIGRLGGRLEEGGVVCLRTPTAYGEAAEVDGLEGPVAVKYGGMLLQVYQRGLG
ncbi:MAG: RsmD family RNA methyltransferase [Phycisphaeraceae bacterium]